MSPDELERLLWEQAEGVIGAADRERLAAAVAADAEAERRRREVVACAELLAAVPPAPAPPALRASIAAALAALPQPRPRAAWRGRVAALFAPPPRLAWAAAGALLAAAAALLLLADRGRVGEERLVGAIGTGPGEARGAATVALPDGLGSLSWLARGRELLCQLAIDRAVPGGVTLDVTGAGVAVAGFEADGVAASQVATAPGAVGVAVDGTGAVSVSVRVAPEASEVTVRVLVAGRPVVERAVAVGGAETQ